LTARSDFGPNGTPTFLIEIRNNGSGPISVDTHQVGPALLGPIEKSPFLASDGGSIAVITRGDLVNHSWRQGTVAGITHSWSYTIDPRTRPTERVQLNPGQSMKARIAFQVPPGEYQFMFGYGGGVHEEMCLASNAISFDLNDSGVASLAK
jgi:hypothetical protein